MKRLLFILMAALTVACSSDPVFHGLTQKEKESFAQSIAGEYPGRYEIAYTDVQNPDTTGDDKLHHYTVSGATLSVSDLTMHTVIFNDFPVSLLAHVVDDPELSHALSTLPNMGLTGSYEFHQTADSDRLDWNYILNPISLSLTYGGQKHNILLQFDNTYYSFVEFTKGQIAFEQQAVLQLQLTAIYDGQRLLHDFNIWTSHDRLLIAQFYFGLK